jgi:hypothetical protein
VNEVNTPSEIRVEALRRRVMQVFLPEDVAGSRLEMPMGLCLLQNCGHVTQPSSLHPGMSTAFPLCNSSVNNKTEGLELFSYGNMKQERQCTYKCNAVAVEMQ